MFYFDLVSIYCFHLHLILSWNKLPFFGILNKYYRFVKKKWKSLETSLISHVTVFFLQSKCNSHSLALITFLFLLSIQLSTTITHTLCQTVNILWKIYYIHQEFISLCTNKIKNNTHQHNIISLNIHHTTHTVLNALFLFFSMLEE